MKIQRFALRVCRLVNPAPPWDLVYTRVLTNDSDAWSKTEITRVLDALHALGKSRCQDLYDSFVRTREELLRC